MVHKAQDVFAELVLALSGMCSLRSHSLLGLLYPVNPACGPPQAGAEAARRRVRAELMRWHPDKFGARFGARLAARERAGVLERVKAVAQMLTELGRQVAAEAAGA